MKVPEGWRDGSRLPRVGLGCSDANRSTSASGQKRSFGCIPARHLSVGSA